MIDTHCHLTYSPLCDRIDTVIAEARDAGVHRMISVGTTPDDATRAASLAAAYDPLFATVGLHPNYSGEFTDQAALTAAMHTLADHPKVVAFGEMGLDCHYPDPPLDRQRPMFACQLDAVTAYPKPMPVIIHNRKATDAVLAMIRESTIPGDRFVFHCFTGSAAELRQILDLGAMVSLTGIITFNSARDIAEASDMIPLDRLMIETDSPYLTPEPHRKVRPNEPKYVPHVARFLASRRGMTEPDFVAAVDANATRFFGLPA